MTELPAGWERATAGELGEYINGRGFKKTEWSTAGRPIIRIQNLTGSGSGFNYFQGPLEDRYVVPAGSLLVSWAATLGVYRWPGPEGALNQHIFKVRSFINEDFHRCLLEHALDVMQEHTHGSGMVHITRGRFDSTPVPVPPLAEQERIVVAIEEAFSKLDAGEAGLRTVRQLLKRMRDAVLAAAATGRLVPQDPTDTPVTKLLADLGVEAIVTGAVVTLPDGWAWAALGSISESVRNGIFVSRPPESPPGVPILRIGAVRRLELDLTDVRFARVDVADPAVARALLLSGDLLFTRYNGNPAFVGACAVVPAIDSPLLHPDKLIRVVVNRVVAEPKFVATTAAAGTSRSFIEAVTKTTAGQAGISGSDLRLVPIPLAPLEEQRRIVSEVERQFSFLEACERAVGTGLAHAAALRRSVLKAAFEGKLVPQDPSDEPASVLLERIRAERGAAPKAARRSRRTA